MWQDFGTYWNERTNSAPILASIHAMMHEMNILLVDHDQEAVNIANDLEISQCKVTIVGVAHVAISMLGKVKFDAVMVNISSPDHQGFGLLMHHAINMCIPVVCMADNEDPHVTMWALENGAFVCIKRPPTLDFLRYLWQHVMREKTKLIRERDFMMPPNNRGVEFRDVANQRNDNANPNPNPNPNSNHTSNMGRLKMRRGRFNGYGEGYDSDTINPNGNVRRKMCTEWTQELHTKFIDAVQQLGEGRCFPKEILELMNEPGLTRMQVASHLQKCRNDNWRSPEERKPGLQGSMQSSPNGTRVQTKPRRFGSMPLVSKPFSSQTNLGKGTQEIGQCSQTRWEVPTPNEGGKMGNGMMMSENTPHHQYGGSSSMNPRHPADEYFNFPDMDSLMRDLSARQPETENPNPNPNPNPAQEGYQGDHPAPQNDDKNSGEGNMKEN